MKARGNYNRLGLRQRAFVMVQALFSEKGNFCWISVYQRKLIADN